MRILRFRIGIAARMILLAVGLAAAGVAAMTLSKIAAVRDGKMEVAAEKLEIALRALKHEATRGRPVRVDGDRLLVGDEALNGRNDIVDTVRATTGAVATIFLGDLRIATNVVRPDGTRGVGTRLAPGPAYDAAIGRGVTYRGENEILGRRHITIYEPILDPAGQRIGLWFVGIPIDEVAAAVDAARWNAILLGAAVLAVTTLLMWLVTSLMVARPLTRSVERLRSLRDGDTTSPIPGIGRKDELGNLAEAMEVFRDTLEASRRMQEEVARKEREANEARRKAARDAADALEAKVGDIVRSVASAATEMEATASTLANGAERTSHQATSVAAAAEQASANVQTVAAAAEELSASIQEIGRQVQESTRMAKAAVDTAERTNATVEALAASAQRIGEVVGLINDIAGRTNLLALNATIEAARAGDAGKGFAVVASEVKNLASQTAKATEEIASQITGIQGETQRAVEAIRSISGTIERISEVASAIAAAVEQQGAATQEIARNVQQAAKGTTDVSNTIGGVQRIADETGVSAQHMRQAAQALSRNAEELKRQIERYIADVKAA